MLTTLTYALLALAVGICLWGVARIIGNFKREKWIKARGENLGKLKRQKPAENEETKRRLKRFVERLREKNDRKG